jgi:hypothetical protein
MMGRRGEEKGGGKCRYHMKRFSSSCGIVFFHFLLKMTFHIRHKPRRGVLTNTHVAPGKVE